MANTKDLTKIARLLSKVKGSELNEESPIDSISNALEEHHDCFEELPRQDKKDSWIYDSTELDSLPIILKTRLADNLHALKHKIAISGDKSDSGYVWQYADGQTSEGINPHDLSDAEYFETYLDTLSQDELQSLIDDLDQYQLDDLEDDEYPYEEDGCWDEDVVESVETAEDISCLNEQGLFDINKFKTLTPASRSALARTMRNNARSGKTKTTKEMNKHRRVVDVAKLLQRAKMAAKRMLEKKYLPGYENASISSRNNFNRMIHTSKASEFAKDVKMKFKEIRAKEMTKPL